MRSIFSSAVCALALVACTVDHEPPNLAGQDVRLTIIHTADIHSRIFPYNFVPGTIDKSLGLNPLNGPYGGIARIAQIVKEQRASAARSIHVDSGDCFQGAPVFNLYSGEAEFRSLSALGLDVMALGNHEFDKGAVNLELQQLRYARFPILAANYVFDDPGEAGRPKLGETIKPFTIINADGVRIAVIGLANTSTVTSLQEGGNSLGARSLDEKQVLLHYVPLLRPQVNVVAIVSHLGLDEDENVAANMVADQNLALGDALNGVNFLFGGHLHIVLMPPKIIPHLDPQGNRIGQTVLIHSGAFAKYVGRVDALVHIVDPKVAGDKPGVVSFSYKLFPVENNFIDPNSGEKKPQKQDPDVARMLEPYAQALNLRFDLNRVFAYVTSASKVTRNDPTGGDSQLGNLVAASMRLRNRVDADFAITNSLGIRADFEQGPLTIEQMFNVFPFENTITTMFLSGSEVQDTLDFVARKSASRGCRTQIQVSGITFKMDCTMQDPSQHDVGKSYDVYVGDACRMPDGTIDPAKISDGRCKKLDLAASYRVAVNDYIAIGGSGFSVLKQNTTKFNTGISLRDALTDYLRALNSDPKYACAATDVSSAQYTGIACIRPDIEAHDNRIFPISNAQVEVQP